MTFKSEQNSSWTLRKAKFGSNLGSPLHKVPNDSSKSQISKKVNSNPGFSNERFTNVNLFLELPMMEHLLMSSAEDFFSNDARTEVLQKKYIREFLSSSNMNRVVTAYGTVVREDESSWMTIYNRLRRDYLKSQGFKVRVKWGQSGSNLIDWLGFRVGTSGSWLGWGQRKRLYGSNEGHIKVMQIITFSSCDRRVQVFSIFLS